MAHKTPRTEDEHADWNEEMARRYDPDLYHQHPSPVIRFVRNRRVRAIHKLLQLERHHRVLDVGCGAGNILAELDAERHGVDLSEFLLEKARRRLGESVQLKLAPGEKVPYPDAHFDRLVCSEVLEHVLDPTEVLREMRRLVRPDGAVVVSVPNEVLITRVKGVLLKTRLFALVTGRNRGGYQTPEKMEDEWHISEFSSSLLQAVSEPYFRIDKVMSIPIPGFPLGFAARLIPR